MGALQEREPRPQAAAAVENGGVLAVLPALLQAGLLRLPPGFFGARSILLTLAFMLLAALDVWLSALAGDCAYSDDCEHRFLLIVNTGSYPL